MAQIPAVPYRVVKGFIYNGVQFQPNDLFLPDMFNVPSHKMNSLISNRNLNLATSYTQKEAEDARSRIEKALAEGRRGMVKKNGEKEFSALPKQEEKPVEEEAPKEPAEEPKEAEEGEADKAVEEEAPATPTRRRRR